MRLRYFHIRNYPPLHDVEIVFSAQSPLNTLNAIHFVVGINGSGKTHLLQALTETFLCMESKRPPKFSVTLVYELGKSKDKKQTYIFEHDTEQSSLNWWQSAPKFSQPSDAQTERFRNDLRHVQQSPNSDWKPLIDNGNWPGEEISLYLPKTVLAYTTGIPDGWRELFLEPASIDMPDDETEPDEYPLGWTIAHELHRNAGGIGTQMPTPPLDPEPQQETEVCQFVTPFMLKLAVIAVTLNLAREELKQYRTDAEHTAFINTIKDKTDTEGLRGLLSQVGWVWPVSLVIECQPDDEIVREKDENNSATKFWQAYIKAATTILPETEPDKKYRIIFDLDNRDKKKESALEDLLDLKESAFEVFQKLLELHRHKLLNKISIALRKADTDDILLFDELSDGEQMYLGRMALFHLLEDQDDALLLLDEPETHFNDRWKRDLVDIIDQVIGNQANHVLISTHSGITLTDVFTDEITVIEKDKLGNSVHKILDDIHTFGATPDHPLRDVFGAPGTVGKRASALLDILLLCEPNKELVEQLWHPETDIESNSELISVFVTAVQAEYKEKYTEKRIKTILQILRIVAVNKAASPTVSAVVEYFADIVGPGYYQFDLYRSVYRLKKGDAQADATPS